MWRNGDYAYDTSCMYAETDDKAFPNLASRKRYRCIEPVCGSQKDICRCNYCNGIPHCLPAMKYQTKCAKTICVLLLRHPADTQ